MNINTLTIKAQEALQAALNLCAGARTAGCRAAPSARGADPRGRFAGHVPAGTRRRERARTARRNPARRRLPAAGRGRRRAVLCAGDLEGDSACRGLHQELRRQIRFGRTPSAGARVAERGQAADILKRSGATEKELLEAIRIFRKGATVDSQTSEQQFDALGKYAVNLNEQARSGKARPGDRPRRGDPARAADSLAPHQEQSDSGRRSRRGQDRHRRGHCPPYRGRRRARKPEIEGDLLARHGAPLSRAPSIRASSRSGLKAVVQEVVASEGEILLFIDEIHTLVGAGKSSGAMDAANILKPALARGDLRTIGATTLDEYQKYFEQDKALERRFQKVMVDEPTQEDAISILRGLKDRYENHHQVASRTRRSSPPSNFRRVTSPRVSCPTRRSTSWTRRLRACVWR